MTGHFAMLHTVIATSPRPTASPMASAIGPDTIHNFTATLVFSVLIGTYSTVFIAAPWLVWLGATSDSFVPAAARSGGAEGHGHAPEAVP